MKAVHLICRYEEDTKRPKGIKKIAGSIQHTSEAWCFSNEQAESLIGGTIFFHKTKADKSHLGGKITAFEEIIRDDLARKDRIKFTFTPTTEAKNQRWRGKDHNIAWTGEIIDVEDD
jgi:hypothetical protein